MAIIKPMTAGQELDAGATPSTARDNSVPRALQDVGSAVGRAAEVQQRLREINEKRARFTAELLWQRTQRELDALRSEALINVVPGAGDLAAGLSVAMDERYTAFLDSLPAEQQEGFTERVIADRKVRHRHAAADEVRERALWYEGSIASAVTLAAAEIGADPGRFESKRQAISELIAEADLPDLRLATLRQEAEAVLGSAAAPAGEVEPGAHKGAAI